MGRWVFVRHGESTANAAGVLAGWEDVPLTARGEAQARAAGEALAGERFARVLVSDLARARRSLDLLLDARADRGGPVGPTHIDPALRERHLGTWSGLALADLRADGRIATLHAWADAPPEGESHASLMARALPALARWGEEGPTLMVSHGGLMRALLGLIDGTPTAEIGYVKVDNAQPIVRDLTPGTWGRLLAAL